MPNENNIYKDEEGFSQGFIESLGWWKPDKSIPKIGTSEYIFLREYLYGY